jgi:myo-inositol-1(or 4)-monophosphatase
MPAGLTPLSMLSDAQLKELTKFAESLADLARSVLTPAHAQVETAVELKADGTPVTVADKECERLMRAAINKAYPAHGILGEEFGPERTDAEFCWVLDPIDGTKSFLARVPLYVTLIGLLYRGQPVLGLIDQPILRERVIGDNRTTTLNGRVVRVQEVPLKRAVVLSSDFDMIRTHQPQAAWSQLVPAVAYTRTWGDGYGYLLVASGRAHIMADPVMNPWDLIPVIPIMRGAGAVVTDWKGGDAQKSGHVITAAPSLHAEVLKRLNG